ncbi:MAG TPA: amino acid permease [Blastocatellia bacterium]|nr:amino acid permease [Blastocatellia bacterium]
MAKPTHEGLVRGIRRWDLAAIAINAIIGAGIFGLPSDAFGRIGAYSLFAFAACALVVAIIIFCFAEVASRFNDTGGPYLYAREAFGPLAGFEVGWLIWIARLTAFAANCNLLVGYLSFFWPPANSNPWRPIFITSIVAMVSLVNIIGVRNTAIVTDFFTVGKLIPLMLFIAVGLFFIQPASFALGPAPNTGQFSAACLILIYAFSGFEISVIPAGETRDPRRNLPFALFTSIVTVAIVYVLIQVVCIGTLPELAASKRPLADAATRFLGSTGGAIISAGALISIAGNLNGIMLAGSRLPFAMAERRELPSVIGSVHHQFRTPHISIVITGAFVLALTLSGTFVYAATISAIARLLTYAATCAALPVLRRRERDLPALYRAPAGVALAIAALVLCAWLLSNSTLAQARDATIAASVGLVIYFAHRAAVGKAIASETIVNADETSNA